MRHGVTYEPRFAFDLITGLADLDRRPQQQGRLRCPDATDLVGGLGAAQIRTIETLLHHQLVTHLLAVAVDPEGDVTDPEVQFSPFR